MRPRLRHDLSQLDELDSIIVLPVASHDPNPGLQFTFGLGKLVQFSFPIVFVWCCRRQDLGVHKPSARGLVLGVVFGLVVGAAALILYFAWLKTGPVFAEAPERIYRLLAGFNLATPLGFLGMTFFIVVLHSFLEEYYWRWFVFGRLEKFVPFGWARAVSSCGFMAHHVILLSMYLEGYFWTAVVPFSLGFAGGGIVWAWLYHRCQSLYAPWISHLLVDLALMGLGYDMLAKYWT